MSYKCPHCQTIMYWQGDWDDGEENTYTTYTCPECESEFIYKWEVE